MRTVRTILAVMLTVVCCTQLAAQGFSREQFPEGSYSPVTNINPNGYPRVLALYFANHPGHIIQGEALVAADGELLIMVLPRSEEEQLAAGAGLHA